MGLYTPIWLWLAAAALPLILLYVLKVRREERRVSSTRFWRGAMSELEAQVPFRRLRRNWLLLLQLTVLALLTLSAAGPFRNATLTPGRRIAIVIDVSAPMLAADRMALARREATRLVDGLGPGGEALVVRAGAAPEVIAPLTRDRVLLRKATRSLEADPAPSDVVAALGLARTILGDDGTPILITHVSTEDPAAEGTRTLRVGSSLPNVGIVSMGVRASDASGQDHEVFVRLRNASARSVAGTLQLLLDGVLRDASAVALEPEADAERTLHLVGIDRGRIEVRWEAASEDALVPDDRALWTLRPPRQRRFRVVGDADPFLLQALAAVPGWQPADPAHGVDLEIVVRRSPDPAGPAFVWIDPLELREGIEPRSSVVSWDRTHPVLRHTNLHPLRLGRTPVLRRPPGARLLAGSTAGPLVLEGTRAGRRYIAWGFDPLETDLPLRVSFPVLVQNCLEHLAPSDWSLPGGVRTGTAPVVVWPEAEEVLLTSPSGRERALSASGTGLRLPTLDELGEWHLRSGTRELAFSSSLQDPQLVDLRGTARGGRPVREAAPPTAATPAPTSSDRTGITRALWRAVALIALAVLVIEGFAFHRRWAA